MLAGMADGSSDSPWAATVVLSTGDTAYIRPMTPADRAALAAFHERQSSLSKYRRFFSPKPTLSEEELAHFTDVDMVDRAALVTEVHDDFMAWASYERWPGRPEAEAAFMVDDEYQGHGIATLMLEHLAAIARSNGIDRFTAEVLGDNRAMLAVFAKAGWPLQRRFDSGVVDLDWDLTPTTEFRDSVERREQRADSRAVARILLPRAVAVVGASTREHSIGATLWQNVKDSVDVPVYPVNPAHDKLDGERCYRSIADLPDDVSLAIVAVPATALEETVEACIAKKMRGAVIVTEVSRDPDAPDVRSDEAVAAIVANARRHGLRLIGPSSMGIASPLPGSHIHAALAERGVPPGHVAVSMQSGPLGGSVLRRAADLDMGISWFVSLGEKADVSANDLLQFWLDDDNTKCVVMYTESIGNPRKFARIARRVSRVKPVVAVRTGAAASGELGGALFQEAGLIEVPTVGTMLDTARVLVSQPVLRGPRVAVLTNARSPGTLATAALETAGLTPVAPPVTLDWRSTNDDFHDALAAALADDGVDGVLVLHAPGVPDNVEGAAEWIDRAASASPGKPVVAVPLGARDGALRPGSDVPVFSFPEQAAAVLGRSYAYGQWLATEAERGDPDVSAVDPAAAHAIIFRALESAGEADDEILLDTATQGELLATYGIAMSPAEVVAADDAPASAERLGFPVALKALQRKPGLSVRAGVALDLDSADDVRGAVDSMREALGEASDQLIVQAMANPGIDVRIRCELDERLGVIVAVGLGGIQADVIDDRAIRLAPVSPASAVAMLGETRVGSALRSAVLDPSPLVAAIVQAAQLASDHRDVDSIDLNPVIVSEEEAVVVDARIALRRRGESEPALRRID